MAAERTDRQMPRVPTENQENRAAGEGPPLAGGSEPAEQRTLAHDSEREESGDYETLERESGAAGAPPADTPRSRGREA